MRPDDEEIIENANDLIAGLVGRYPESPMHAKLVLVHALAGVIYKEQAHENSTEVCLRCMLDKAAMSYASVIQVLCDMDSLPTCENFP